MDGPVHFPTTAWNMVRAAKKDDSPEYLAAMNRFIAGYWRPVFYFMRTRGYAFELAQDLTQEFFARWVELDWIDKADPDRGRFRSFLLKVLVRFLSDHGAKRAPKQQLFEGQFVAISALVGEDDREFDPSTTETPEEVFMRSWAQAVIDSVLHRVSRWCEDRGRPDWSEIFFLHHFSPPHQKKMNKQTLADRFGLSRDQIRYAIEQVNEQFATSLRQEVADQVDNDADIDAEIGELEALIS